MKHDDLKQDKEMGNCYDFVKFVNFPCDFMRAVKSFSCKLEGGNVSACLFLPGADSFLWLMADS